MKKPRLAHATRHNGPRHLCPFFLILTRAKRATHFQRVDSPLPSRLMMDFAGNFLLLQTGERPWKLTTTLLGFQLPPRPTLASDLDLRFTAPGKQQRSRSQERGSGFQSRAICSSATVAGRRRFAAATSATEHPLPPDCSEPRAAKQHHRRGVVAAPHNRLQRTTVRGSRICSRPAASPSRHGSGTAPPGCSRPPASMRHHQRRCVAVVACGAGGL